MRVVISAAAKNDLIEIGDFIAIHNRERAKSFVNELLQKCEALGDMPRAFPLVPRYECYDVRRLVFRDYLIFYRVGEMVEIARVLHGAQDYEPLLFDGIPPQQQGRSRD